MNKKPVDYKQSDKRWANIPYNWPGGNGKTIESSGCGPTCGAMVIATIADSKITPVESCAWSVAHGYRVNGGTANGYFKAYMSQYGIDCRQLMKGSIINQPNHSIHQEVKQYLSEGYWIIALMGRKSISERGTWTTGGHFILVWDWDDKVRILDPIHATGNNKYTNGDPLTFKNEVRQYWLVDAREYNRKQEEEDMITQEQFNQLMNNYIAEQVKKPCSYAEEQAAMQWAQAIGLIKGDETGNTMPKKNLTRGEMAILLQRFSQISK